MLIIRAKLALLYIIVLADAFIPISSHILHKILFRKDLCYHRIDHMKEFLHRYLLLQVKEL